jgi:cytochrome c oxidase subunit 4
MENGISHAADTPQHSDHAGAAHVVPWHVLATVFIALLALTYITVAVTAINLGSLNLWIALGVATAKGALVVLYFMHLRYDSTFNSIVFLTAFVFLFLFLGIVIMDSIAYQPAVFDVMAPGQ